MKKKRICLYIEEARYNKIIKLAAKAERTISSMIDQIFKKYIDSQKK